MAYDGTVASPVYQPAVRTVSNITQANVGVFTTTVDHNYTDTDIVTVFIPSGFGMSQINNMKGRVTVIDATSFSLPIDTRTFDAFAVANNGQLAQSIPDGQLNSTTRGPVYNTLPSRVRNFQ